MLVSWPLLRPHEWRKTDEEKPREINRSVFSAETILNEFSDNLGSGEFEIGIECLGR
jgi:hypothetical protein